MIPELVGDETELLAPFEIHGGNLAAAHAAFPSARQPWIDLSTGIAPWPYTIRGLPVECWSRLPEVAEIEALAAAARKYYCAPAGARVVPVAGTDLAIALLPRLVTAPARVAIVSPTYAGHAMAWRQASHAVREVRALADIFDGEIGVVVNPNNPDGRTSPPQDLLATAARLSKHGGFLVIDEAFADTAPDTSVLNGRNAAPGAVVLRSVGKFFGLAGLRLGFIVSAHPLAATLAAALGAWPVSGPAVAIGTRAFADHAWTAAQRTRLSAAARSLDETLAGRGFSPMGGTDLFRLLETPGGACLFRHLCAAGILVRPFGGGTRLRFGLPADDAVFGRLDAALAAWKKAPIAT